MSVLLDEADPRQVIADLKRKLAESNAERDEALAQQAATKEVLQVINSSAVTSARSSTRCWTRHSVSAAPISA